MLTEPLSKTSLLPAEIWTKISDRVQELDALLRLTCVNKSMQKSTEIAIMFALKYDNFLFTTLLECLKIEIGFHIGHDMHFAETGRLHEPGSPVVSKGYLAYTLGWDFTSGGVHYYAQPPPNRVAKLAVRNGYVKTIGGLTFAFPGDNGVVEIETLVTMNASGVDCVVLRSLDGQKMISNLDPGGLDLPSGSGIDVFLKLFDRSAGRLFWEEKLPTWQPHPDMHEYFSYEDDDMFSDDMIPSELEGNEVDDKANIAGEDEAACSIVEEPDCYIVECGDCTVEDA